MELLHCGFDALPETLRTWRAAAPDMGLLALLPEAEKTRLPVLQALCRQHGIPLAGAIFPAVLTAQGFVQDGVCLCRFERAPSVALLPLEQRDAAQDAARVAAAIEPGLPETADPKPTLYLFFDGLIGTIASILDELYLRLADRVTYAGVNAGSETFQPMPCLFDQEQVIGQGVLALLVNTPMHTVLEHGYTVPERVMTATSTRGNAIRNIDWQPAFEVYRRIIREEYGVELTRENFYQYAVHFPVGILRAGDGVVVRIPVALDDNGALLCIGEVPENAMLTLLRAPAANAEGCIDRLAQTLAGEHRAPVGPLLTFYCAGRRMHLADDALLELARLQACSGAAQLAGALSLGEIGCTGSWGYPMFHNATLVCSTPSSGEATRFGDEAVTATV